MNTGKQIILFFLFLILTTLLIVQVILLFLEKIINYERIIGLGITVSLLFFLIQYIVRSEKKVKNNTVELLKKNSTVIYHWSYDIEEWIPFSKKLIKKEIWKYYIIFSVIFSIITAFVTLLIMSDDYIVGYVFLFIFSSILFPVIINDVRRFYKKRDAYLTVSKPEVKITFNGVLINSKIAYSYSSPFEIYSVKLAEKFLVNCLLFTIKQTLPRGGASFKDCYVPVPSNEESSPEEILEKIKFKLHID